MCIPCFINNFLNYVKISWTTIFVICTHAFNIFLQNTKMLTNMSSRFDKLISTNDSQVNENQISISTFIIMLNENRSNSDIQLYFKFKSSSRIQFREVFKLLENIFNHFKLRSDLIQMPQKSQMLLLIPSKYSYIP